ncbi:hypothetical protein BY996DRAFT_1399768 [Phakopsora pachyrhizi]|nr:hypothetical protein BY996DRAFT_1399768 [Phakopsora pachyrhizi]
MLISIRKILFQLSLLANFTHGVKEAIDFFGSLPINPEIGRGITNSFAQPMDLYGITDQGNWLSLKTLSSDEYQDGLNFSKESSFSPLKESEKFFPHAKDLSRETNHKNPRLDWQADLDSFKTSDQMYQAVINAESQPPAQIFNQFDENGIAWKSSFFRPSNQRHPRNLDHTSFPESGNSATYSVEVEGSKQQKILMVPFDSAQSGNHKFNLAVNSMVKNKQKNPAEYLDETGTFEFNKYLGNKASETDLKQALHNMENISWDPRSANRGHSQAKDFYFEGNALDNLITLAENHDIPTYSNYLGNNILAPTINTQETLSNRRIDIIKNEQKKAVKYLRDRYNEKGPKRKFTEEYSFSKKVFEKGKKKRKSNPTNILGTEYLNLGLKNNINIVTSNCKSFKDALTELLEPKNFPLQLNLLTGYSDDAMRINDKKSKDSILRSFKLMSQRFGILGNKIFHVKNEQVPTFLQLPKSSTFKFIPREDTQLRLVKYPTASCVKLKVEISAMDFGDLIEKYMLADKSNIFGEIHELWGPKIDKKIESDFIQNVSFQKLFFVYSVIINKVFGGELNEKDLIGRQIDAIEFYALVHKTLQKTGTNFLTLENKEITFKRNDKLEAFVTSYNNLMYCKSYNNLLASIWGLVELWLIHHRADLYEHLAGNQGLKNNFKPFVNTIFQSIFQIYF